jgi:hypothetical protein
MKKILVLFIVILLSISCNKINNYIDEDITDTFIHPTEKNDEWMDDYLSSSITINDKIVYINSDDHTGDLEKITERDTTSKSFYRLPKEK